jgi:hypothetical protein
MMRKILPVILAFSFYGFASSASAALGERGAERRRGHGHGEALACAQRLGIALPAPGSGEPLTAEQREQLRPCLEQFREARHAFHEAMKDCLAASGVAVPEPGQARAPADAAVREKVRACMAQVRDQQEAGEAPREPSLDSSANR